MAVASICHFSFSSKLPFFTFTSLSHPLHSRQLRIISCLSLDQTTNASSSTAAVTDNLRVIFAAGGTGGHIYPAVAIADELKTLNHKTEILFVGTPSGMESVVMPSVGYPFTAIPAVALARPIFSLFNLFVFPFLLANSLYKSFQTLQEFKPHIVVGTGGYVSFPICLAATLTGQKLVIQEQNSVPGIANWVLSLFAQRVFLAFDSSVESFWRKNKCLVLGNPVRSSLRTYVSKAKARCHFFPKAEEEGEGKMKVVLVLGGSLGANTVNVELFHLYQQMLSERNDLFIIWQTGVEAFHEMESLVKNHPRLVLTPFSHSLDLAYAAADLIVSRAGAMTCSEILATGKPSILIPSPNAAEGHQCRNAFLMADLAGLRVITEDELDSITLKTAIEEILDDESLLLKMSELALKAAKPNAATEIAQEILSLVSL